MPALIIVRFISGRFVVMRRIQLFDHSAHYQYINALS